jgi:diaminohydroxyphosphoribosylaminopyrimidine deaminase / 5-amino-6-(5-phosphoribosylamino)uracil reductase
MSAAMEQHERWMRRALSLARRAEGMTRPNPPVGAVIVNRGRVVGEGYHRKAGGPHAEIHALNQAGRRARGGTLYVTLEPCSTWGRTPPCTDAILAAGVKTVVAAVRDPNPAHAGRGLRLLSRRGVRIVEGVCAADASALIAPFAKWITTGRPYVTLKLGTTLDGRIADRLYRSRWITGPEAREEVQAMRRRADAIMVGAGTVRADNPSLLPRPPKGRRPWRVIVSSDGRLPAESKVFGDGCARQTIVCVSARCPSEKRRRLAATGAEVVPLPGRKHRVSLASMLRFLWRKGVLHVLCEGGGELAAALVKGGLVDEIVFLIAPRILGSRGPVPAFGGVNWLLGKEPRLTIRSVDRAGDDIVVRAVPWRD